MARVTNMITEATAESILVYLEKDEYTTFRRALFPLIWTTGTRPGTVRGIDLGDYYPEENYLKVAHRPETETRLENQNQAEREINIHSWVCDILDDYLEMHRAEATDEYGRESLLTTKHGRPRRSTLRPQLSALTRPRHYTGDCPHGRDQNDCDATEYRFAQRCPSSTL